MKTWQRYREYLLRGEWHVHTNYTDGKNTVEELCNEAERRHIPLIAFTEHVRKHLKYSFEDLLADIDRARDEHPSLIILSGVEAKVLPDGTLDVSDDIIKTVDYPIFAYHSFPDDTELYFHTLEAVISKNEYVNAWAHPGLFLAKRGLPGSVIDIGHILNLIKEHNVLLELNHKYNLPFEQWREYAEQRHVALVCGDDIHSIHDFDRFEVCRNIATLKN